MEKALRELGEAAFRLKCLATDTLPGNTNRLERKCLIALASMGDAIVETANSFISERQMDHWLLTRQVDSLKTFSERLPQQAVIDQVEEIDRIRRCRVVGKFF